MNDPNNNNNLPLDPTQASASPGQAQPQVSTGGFSPETVAAPVKTETQPAEESGYEQIKRIEKQANEEAQEQRPPQQPPSLPKSDPFKEKKEQSPQQTKPKYFGYTAPLQITNNPGYIEQRAGKGNKKDSKTWLLIFLDRLLKKQKTA